VAKTYDVWTDLSGVSVTVPDGVDPDTPAGYAALRDAARDKLKALLDNEFSIDWSGPNEDGPLVRALAEQIAAEWKARGRTREEIVREFGQALDVGSGEWAEGTGPVS